MRLDPKVMVMGCTHYPLLKPTIANSVRPGRQALVDSGERANPALGRRAVAVAGGLAEGDAGA